MEADADMDKKRRERENRGTTFNVTLDEMEEKKKRGKF